MASLAGPGCFVLKKKNEGRRTASSSVRASRLQILLFFFFFYFWKSSISFPYLERDTEWLNRMYASVVRPQGDAVNNHTWGSGGSVQTVCGMHRSQPCCWGNSPAFQQGINHIPAFPWSPTYHAETLDPGGGASGASRLLDCSI